MKLVHIVLLKFRPEATEDIKNRLSKDILALRNEIPQVINISSGTNLTNRGKGYEYAMIIELETMEDLSLYINHQSHQNLLATYKSLFEDMLAFDFQI